jgi:hypothetical protein
MMALRGACGSLARVWTHPRRPSDTSSLPTTPACSATVRQITDPRARTHTQIHTHTHRYTHGLVVVSSGSDDWFQVCVALLR